MAHAKFEPGEEGLSVDASSKGLGCGQSGERFKWLATDRALVYDNYISGKVRFGNRPPPAKGDRDNVVI